MKKRILGIVVALFASVNLFAASGGFTFNYNVGTVVTNYHAYGLACLIGDAPAQPVGTVVLGRWWVYDLGHVIGSGTATCRSPVSKLEAAQTIGVMMFADASDVGGQDFTHPVAWIEKFTRHYYNGYAAIQMLPSGQEIYWGPPFSPFGWDLSPYLW